MIIIISKKLLNTQNNIYITKNTNFNILKTTFFLSISALTFVPLFSVSENDYSNPRTNKVGSLTIHIWRNDKKEHIHSP